jgi:hypothetical protein
MRRKTVLVLAVFAVAFVAGLATGPAADALPPNCFPYCDGYQYSATMTGQGIDCAHAEADLQAKLNAAVDCTSEFPGEEIPLGLCSKETVITQACYCTGCCDYRVEGYVKYRCRWCMSY